MRFGIVSPAIPGLVAQCETAEALGFDQAWLFDSHMVYADVYVIMALCAERTRRMCFGTGIAVAPSRIAPITAHSIATLNQLYPGRVALGLGTGNTGRRTMGFPPMKAREFRDYVRTVKGLLRGKTVEHREGDIARPIRLLHPGQGIVNLDGPIPVYVAAFGRQVMRMAGEFGDGFISFGGTRSCGGGLPHYRFPDRLCPLSGRAGRFDCGPHGRRPGNLRLAALFHSRRNGGR